MKKRQSSAVIDLPAESVRITPWGADRRKKFVSESAKRSTFLLGGAQSEVQSALEGSIEHFDDGRQRYQELCVRADAGDSAAQQELQEIRIWSINNFLTANINYGSWLEIENLGDSDIPMYENTLREEAIISFVGQDGGEPRWQTILNHTKTPVPAFWLTSGKFEYPLYDEYTGNISDRAKGNVDIAFDMDAKLDALLFGYLQALIGPFSLTGTKANRVYVAHSRIKTANLPTSNLLTPADNTSSSIFRRSCLDVIVAYAWAWGNAFGDGQLRPAVVNIPSAHMTGFLDEIDVADPNNEYNKQVFEFGTVLTYAGIKWLFVADATLDPTLGRAYVRFNKPIGKLWTKTGLDKMITNEAQPEAQAQNLAWMLERKVFFAAFPAHLRMNIAAVQYRTV